MEFSRQEYWSGLLFATPGDFSSPGIEPASFVSPALAGGFFTTLPPGSLGLGNLSVFEVYGSQKLWTTVSRKRLQQLGQQDKHEPQNVAFEVGDILN